MRQDLFGLNITNLSNDNLTVREAAEKYIPWEVVKAPLEAFLPEGFEDEEGSREVKSHYATMRSDTKEVLGVVGKGYAPVQPRTMVSFCESLCESGQVRIEDIGIWGRGRKLWFLLRGQDFVFRNDDLVNSYMMISNGFDGKTMFKSCVTSIRPRCANILHFLFKNSTASFAMRHTRNVLGLVENAKRALNLYSSAIEYNGVNMNKLAKKDVSSSEMQDFWESLYTKHFGRIYTNPETKKEERKLAHALEFLGGCLKTFSEEEDMAGPTLWNAVNAYTKAIQHGEQRKYKFEVRQNSNIFGINAERTQEAFSAAYSLVS